MNRVCILKSTGEVIEFQSGGYVEGDKELSDKRLSILKENAINSGYKEDQIEVKWISEEQSSTIIEAFNTSDDAIINRIISDKVKEIAIADLVSEGKLTKDGKLRKGI
jgi:coenzyme F420-reducing hydrogenase delta subunit